MEPVHRRRLIGTIRPAFFNQALRRVVTVVGLLLAPATVLQGSEEFRLYTEETTVSEGGKTTACVWLANGCRFRFLPPRGWSIQCQATNATVLLTQPDLKAAIRLVLHRDPEATNRPLDSAVWRERVKDRHPKAVIVRESMCIIADREGWGCDLTIPVAKSTAALVRVVVVPYPRGVAELEMRSTTVDERLARRAMRGVLNSLTIEPAAAKGPASR